MTDATTTSDGDDVLDELIAKCLDAIERGRPGVVDSVCDEHPDLADTLRRRLRHLDVLGLLGSGDRADVPGTEPDPDLGPYDVLERLGQGGMGTVYLAQQREPIRRKVAVKVIRAGLDSQEVIRRFEMERQALAMMDHPGIAKVFHAGSTASGRPFFAMEYFPGKPIATFCDDHGLPTRERIELFITVCEAVHHAHQRGVIHRDVKPSNILVMEQDGRARPKVIDFGVAKGSLASGAFQTEHGRLLGTPEYMSPEQAREDPRKLDRRTDVYALGVVLYELLSGCLPFESERLRSAGPSELLRILAEEQPEPPSTRVAATRDSATADVATTRQTDLRSLSRVLRGDLDWITLKALEKDPGRRYATAFDLAEDLRRHLAHRPVVAGPPTKLYRFGKFMRKRRTAVAVFTLAALLVAALPVSLWLQDRAAQAAQNEALDTATAFIERIEGVILDENVVGTSGSSKIRERLIREALDYYESITAEHDASPAFQRRAISLHLKFGNVLATLESHGEARAAWRRCIELVDTLPDLTPAECFDAGNARLELIKSHAFHGEHDEVCARAEELLRWVDGELEVSPDSPSLAYLRISALGHLASVADERGQYAERAAYLDEARNLCEEARSRRDTRHLRSLSAILDTNEGVIALNAALWEEAARLFASALATQREIVEEQPGDSRARRQIIRMQTAHVSALRMLRRYDEALAGLEEAEDQAQWLLAKDPDRADYSSSLGATYHTMAQVHLDVGDDDLAMESLDEAIELQEKALEKNPEHQGYRSYLVSHLGVRCDVFLHRKRPAELERPLERMAEVDDSASTMALIARYHARRIRAAKAADDIEPTEREQVQQRYASQALAALRAASELGFGDMQFLRDSVFKPLHENPEFREIANAVRAAGDG